MEIADAVKKIVQSGVSAEEITPELIAQNIYAPEVPPCDLIVRTSSEQRLSNFMLWRSAYSELMFIEKNWPDMTVEDVSMILEEYANRNRRFGKLIIWGVLLGLFVLILLVVLHELGHAIVAKRNGVKVEEFGVGFPPAAKKWKVKRSFLGENVTFSLNWLPLGGFVRLKGEYDSAKGEGTYGGSTFWVRRKSCWLAS